MRTTLLAIVLFLTATVFAQETPGTFSLQQAQEFAIQNNLTLINAQNDANIAHEQYKQTLGSGLPQVDGTLQYTTNFNYEMNFSLGGDYTADDLAALPLDEGDYALLGLMSGGGPTILQDQVNGVVKVTQLLFSGQFWVGLKMTKLAEKLAQTNVTLTELDVRENVINSYYLALSTEEILHIINKNKESIEEILKHTENMYKLGMAELTDVNQLRINLSRLENSKKAMERNMQLNKNMLRFSMGYTEDQDIALSDSLPALIEQLLNTNMFDINFDMAANPTYQIMTTQEELQLKNVNSEKWAYSPTLAGYYNYTGKIVASDFDLQPNNVAGIQLSVPLFTGFSRKAKIGQAKIELDKATNNRMLLEEQLRLQNNQLSFELRNAFENYTMQKENVAVAREVFDSFNNKYKQGQISSLDLTQANVNVLTAENDYISSILSLLQAKLQLDKLYNNF